MNCHHVEALKTMELDEVIWKKVNIFKKQKYNHSEKSQSR